MKNTSNLLNGLSGKFVSANKYCSKYVPDANITTPVMFISYEFIQNFVEYSMVNFKDWSNVQIDKSTIRSNLLQFKLLDLEYVVDGLFDFELAPFYQNDITFKCQILKNFDASFDIQSKVLMQGLDWQCYAFVQNVNGQQVKVMGKFLLIFQISNQESNIMLNLTLDQI